MKNLIFIVCVLAAACVFCSLGCDSTDAGELAPIQKDITPTQKCDVVQGKCPVQKCPVQKCCPVQKSSLEKCCQPRARRGIFVRSRYVSVTVERRRVRIGIR